MDRHEIKRTLATMSIAALLALGDGGLQSFVDVGSAAAAPLATWNPGSQAPCAVGSRRGGALGVGGGPAQRASRGSQAIGFGLGAAEGGPGGSQALGAG